MSLDFLVARSEAVKDRIVKGGQFLARLNFVISNQRSMYIFTYDNTIKLVSSSSFNISRLYSITKIGASSL